MGLPRPVVRIANAITNAAIIAGIPRPPYTRRNALVIETFGRRSGKRRRIPVGFLDDDGRIIVVVEDGPDSNWVRNVLARDGQLRIPTRPLAVGEAPDARGGPRDVPAPYEPDPCRSGSKPLLHSRGCGTCPRIIGARRLQAVAADTQQLGPINPW